MDRVAWVKSFPTVQLKDAALAVKHWLPLPQPAYSNVAIALILSMYARIAAQKIYTYHLLISAVDAKPFQLASV